MDPRRFDQVVQALAIPSRRRLISSSLTALSSLLLGAGVNESLAGKGKKKKRNNKHKKKRNGTPCSPDPHCGNEGECHNGVCFCPTREQFCGGTCCSPLWLEQEVCVDDRVCCHPSAACGRECCPGDDYCIDGACCPYRRSCYNADAGRMVCCGPDESCVPQAGRPAESTCCPVERTCGGVCCESDQVCCNGQCCEAHGTCCDGECCAADETCTGNGPGRRCCANDHLCDGTCCDIADACVDGQCCDRRALTIRDETCCPTGSGNNYICGRFRCHAYLTGSGPGGCDLWCDPSEEGSLCGPGVPGIPTGENNGRACCCTEPGTSTCLWP